MENYINIVVAECGIGKVFAAICTQAMIMLFNPDYIINTGVGGSLYSNLKIGDIAIAVSTVQHDMDTTAVGDPIGLISGINKVYFDCNRDCIKRLEKSAQDTGIHYEKGVIASGDCFLNDSKKKSLLVENFNAIVCEMEGGSIGQVCYVNNTAYCVLRAISDSGDENSDVDYKESLEMASDAALKVLDTFLKSF